MTRRLINISFVSSLVVLFFCGVSALPSFNGATNCGGNSAALNSCGQYVLMVRTHASDRSDFKFSLDHQLDDYELDTLTRLAEPNWIGDGKYLILTTPVDLSGKPKKKLLIVCNKAFSNVPRKRFWKSPRAYAAGYSSGEYELISPEEFDALDKSKFITAAQYLAKHQ